MLKPDMMQMMQEGVRPTIARTARRILTSFLATFITARCVVYLIMTQRIPDLYLFVGQTHVHHLNYGIFLLAGVGGYLLLARPREYGLRRAATAYGIGLGLTFDEFGMWLHLGGGYWQPASLDAIAVIGGVLGLIAVAPRLRDFKPRHWWAAVLLAMGVVLFVWLLIDSFRYVTGVMEPRLEPLDMASPR